MKLVHHFLKLKNIVKWNVISCNDEKINKKKKEEERIVDGRIKKQINKQNKNETLQ